MEAKKQRRKSGEEVESVEKGCMGHEVRVSNKHRIFIQDTAVQVSKQCVYMTHKKTELLR